MGGLIAVHQVAGLLPLAAGGFVLILAFARLRGQSRPVGIAGAVLLVLGSLQPVAYLVLARFAPEPSMPPVSMAPVQAIISVAAALLLGAGVVVTASAIGTGSGRNETP